MNYPDGTSKLISDESPEENIWTCMTCGDEFTDEIATNEHGEPTCQKCLDSEENRKNDET